MEKTGGWGEEGGEGLVLRPMRKCLLEIPRRIRNSVKESNGSGSQGKKTLKKQVGGHITKWDIAPKKTF